MAFEKVGRLSALPAGSVCEVTAGERRFALCNTGDELHALDGECPHRGGPLGQGALHDHTLVCPWHAWEFDCVTGINDYNPAISVRKFEVKVEGEDIFIDVA